MIKKICCDREYGDDIEFCAVCGKPLAVRQDPPAPEDPPVRFAPPQAPPDGLPKPAPDAPVYFAPTAQTQAPAAPQTSMAAPPEPVTVPPPVPYSEQMPAGSLPPEDAWATERLMPLQTNKVMLSVIFSALALSLVIVFVMLLAHVSSGNASPEAAFKKMVACLENADGEKFLDLMNPGELETSIRLYTQSFRFSVDEAKTYLAAQMESFFKMMGIQSFTYRNLEVVYDDEENATVTADIVIKYGSQVSKADVESSTEVNFMKIDGGWVLKDTNFWGSFIGLTNSAANNFSSEEPGYSSQAADDSALREAFKKIVTCLETADGEGLFYLMNPYDMEQQIQSYAEYMDISADEAKAHLMAQIEYDLEMLDMQSLTYDDDSIVVTDSGGGTATVTACVFIRRTEYSYDDGRVEAGTYIEAAFIDIGGTWYLSDRNFLASLYE